MRYLLALIPALVIGVAPATWAADGKVYAGAECVQAQFHHNVGEPLPLGETTEIRYTARGWAYNASPVDPITVVCPIVRDNTDKPIDGAWITVWNQGFGTQVLRCKLDSFFSHLDPLNADPANIGISTDLAPGNPGLWVATLPSNTPLNLKWTTFPATVEDGHHAIVCSLPAVSTLSGAAAASFIISYKIKEK